MTEGNMVTQILANLGINYQPAIRAGQEFARSLEPINVQLERLQKNFRATGMFAGDFASDLNRSKIIYDQYGRELVRVQTQTAEQLKEQAQKSVRDRLEVEKGYLKQAEREVRNFGSRYSEMMSQLERRTGWFFAGLGFYGAQDVFRRTLTTIGEVEMGMIELARIQDDVNFNFKEMRQALFDLGKEYGQTWDVVQDIALRWSQAGLNVVDTLEATRASLLALNTAELNAKQSTEGLIGIMSQWGLDASQLLEVIDKINITADNFVVTSQDLVDGLLRASGSARVLGLTLDETIAVLTAMREASGRTGREVGNALNSILSFIQRDKAISTFERLGIQVWADETKTQFRNVLEIFDQVAARWDEISDDVKDGFVEAASEAGLFNEEFAELVGLQEEWNDLQKRDLSQAMAGVYRRNYLLALFQNWATVEEVLINLARAHGYSLKENERTMEAYQKKVNSLRMALTELAVTVGEAGLLDVMKALVDGTREGIEVFRSLPEPIQDSIIALTGLTAALMGVNLTFRVFMGMGIGTMFINLAARIAGVEAATLGLSSALQILTANPVVRVIAVLGALASTVALYNKHLKESNEISEQSSFRLQQDNLERQRQIDTLRDVLERRKYLISVLENEKATEEEVKKVKEELANIEEIVKYVLGEEAQARLEAAGYTQKAIDAEIDAINAKSKAEKAALQNTIKQQIKQTEAVAEGARKRIQILREEGAAITGLLALEQKAMQFGVGFSKFAAEAHEKQAEFFERIGWDFLAEVNRREAERTRQMARKREQAFKKLVDAETQRQIREQQKILLEAESKILSLKGGLLAGIDYDLSDVGNVSGIGDSDKKKKSSATDPLAFLKAYENQLQLTSLALERLAIQEQMINQAIGDQYPTVEQARQAYLNWANQINLLRQRQEQLRQENRAISQQIAKTGDSTGELTRKFEENRNAILQAQYEISELQKKMQDFEQQMRDMRFNEVMDFFQHQVNMARLSVGQQIDYLKILLNEYQLNTQKRWQIEENLFNLYRKKLSEQLEDVREAYQERLKLIEEEANAEIKAIQKRLDALDEEDRLEDREEERRKHEEKIQELLEKQRYHELRTGREHEEALADIKKQIAEENRRWEQRQREWQREDEKRNLQKQIDDIRRAAEEKKRELERYYQDAIKIMDDATQDMLASLAATDEQWYERGKAWAEKLAQGLREGNLSVVQTALEELRSGIGSARTEFERRQEEGGFTRPPDQGGVVKQPVAVISSGQYKTIGNTAVMHSRALGNLLGVSVSWDNAAKQVTIGGKTFSPLKIDDGKTYVGIRQVAEALGYDVDYDASTRSISIWPRAHTGAFVMRSGLAELLKGERILSPTVTASFDKLANVLANFPNIPDRIAVMLQGGSLNKQIIDQAVDRIVAAIEKRSGIKFGSLVNIGQVSFEDRADIEIFSREIKRQVEIIS